MWCKNLVCGCSLLCFHCASVGPCRFFFIPVTDAFLNFCFCFCIFFSYFGEFFVCFSCCFWHGLKKKKNEGGTTREKRPTTTMFIIKWDTAGLFFFLTSPTRQTFLDAEMDRRGSPTADLLFQRHGCRHSSCGGSRREKMGRARLREVCVRCSHAPSDQ